MYRFVRFIQSIRKLKPILKGEKEKDTTMSFSKVMFQNIMTIVYSYTKGLISIKRLIILSKHAVLLLYLLPELVIESMRLGTVYSGKPEHLH